MLKSLQKPTPIESVGRNGSGATYVPAFQKRSRKKICARRLYRTWVYQKVHSTLRGYGSSKNPAAASGTNRCRVERKVRSNGNPTTCANKACGHCSCIVMRATTKLRLTSMATTRRFQCRLLRPANAVH